MRNTSQLSADAQIAADSTPTLASASWAPWNASEAISKETMKPMPAMAPAPVTAAQPMGGRIVPLLTRLSSHAAPSVPGRLAET